MRASFYTIIVLLCAFVVSILSFADEKNYMRCDRKMGWSNLTDKDKKHLEEEDTSQSDTFSHLVYAKKKTDTDFKMFYVFKVVKAPADDVMAVLSKYEEQSSYLGPEMKKSEVVEPSNKDKPERRMNVRYEFDLGFWIPTTRYQVLHSVRKREDVHVMSGELMWADALIGKPLHVDGFFKTEPLPSNSNYSVITGCNYMVPDIPSFTPGRDGIVNDINDMGFDLMKQTIRRISARVITRDKTQMNDYRARYSKILEQKD